jgi:hypothetical protein
MEPFFNYVAVDPANKDFRKIPALKKSWQTRVGEASYIWLNSTLGAIKDAANPTAHSPNRHFDQFESQMLQAITQSMTGVLTPHRARQGALLPRNEPWLSVSLYPICKNFPRVPIGNATPAPGLSGYPPRPCHLVLSSDLSPQANIWLYPG